FYEKSKRFVEGKLNPYIIKKETGVKKVGVFVNASLAYILEKIDEYGLDLIQLHGEESPEFCKKLRSKILVIKAFKIKDASDVAETKDYSEFCDYFLFDTAG